MSSSITAASTISFPADRDHRVGGVSSVLCRERSAADYGSVAAAPASRAGAVTPRAGRCDDRARAGVLVELARLVERADRAAAS